VCAIKSAVSNLREALGHVADKLKPHLLGFKMSCVNPGDWFDIGCDPLFDPMVRLVYGRKGQVNHFVGQHPIRGKLRRRSLIADAYVDSSASIAKRHTVADTSSFERSDTNQNLRHGKAATIGSH